MKLPAAILFVCILLCACERPADQTQPVVVQTNAPAEGPQESSGHARMLTSLEQIKARAPAEHQYFGRGELPRMRQRLAGLEPGADKIKRLVALYDVGFSELLFEPTPQNAIEHLTQAYEIFPQIVFPKLKNKEIAGINTKFNLGVACLRLGETENCCLRHSSQSCILPIHGNGLHTQQDGSRQAIKYFLEYLEETSGNTVTQAAVDYHYKARWLLNIAYMTLGEYPDQVPERYRIAPDYFRSEVEFPQFENVAPKLDLNTFNHAGGAIVDDFDNDDYLDIFTSSSDPTIQTRFFRNNRDGTFTDRTEAAGLLGLYGGLNMVQADYNNDGNLDVFILRGAWHAEFGKHPNSLLRNNGDGTFTDVTFEAGLGEVHYPTKTAAWADYDNDGDLDLYVANESSPSMRAPSQLFRNNGDGTFIDVAATASVYLEVFGMGTVWGDFNNDRLPDLFVAAYGRNYLFRNNGKGTFSDETTSLGLTRPRRPFPVWFWDFDNDGALDLYVSSTAGPIELLSMDAICDEPALVAPGVFQLSDELGSPARQVTKKFEIPALYRGDGGGGFVEVAQQQNLTYPTEPMGANFGDLNGDGFLDFYLATGDIYYWELRPNVMFLNQDGKRFVNVTMGGRFGHLQKGHGVSFADIDNDGDQDVYVQMGGQYPGDKFNDALFENPGFGHHWITVKLVGGGSNRSAIGARIHVVIVEDGRQRSIYRHVNSGGSFGCNPLRQNIGLGKAEKIESIEVYWPKTDITQTFRDVEMDQTIEIVEGEKRYKTILLKQFVLGGG